MTTTLASSEPSGSAEPGPDDAHPAAAPRRRRSRIPLISAIAVGCVTALLVAILATSKNASEVGTQVVTPLQNKPAPEISGRTLSGANGALSSLRGKWVFLNFFASWCIPCQQEQPELVKFQNAHAADAAIFGVRFDDPDTGPIESLMSKSGATWAIVDNPNAKITYSVTGPPETFLISPAGIVLAHIVGPVSDTMLENVLHQAQLVVTTPSSSSVP
ncbi:MAG TPA: TlpA disulfide reductase family protein [Acidimicrobiales bacterium]|nr:TlpA disulfide reductase family protein [Acidimicrobiales bacterium]